MWTSYSTKDTAELVGLSESTVRACVREGLLDTKADSLPLRFSFQDLKVLRTVLELTEKGVSIRRIRRQLRGLRNRYQENSLARLRIEAHNGHVVVQEEEQMWRADSGQLVFGFQFEAQAGEVTAIPAPQALPGPEFMLCQTADEWFAQALEIEESNPKGAVYAYEQVLRQRPHCTESLINLGRLRAEASEVELATDYFLKALEIDPKEATALYNLGVIAQDMGRDREAIVRYQSALEIDHSLAEAHYNLATIFDRSGDVRAAIRHINAFRKLSKRRT